VKKYKILLCGDSNLDHFNLPDYEFDAYRFEIEVALYNSWLDVLVNGEKYSLSQYDAIWFLVSPLTLFSKQCDIYLSSLSEFLKKNKQCTVLVNALNFHKDTCFPMGNRAENFEAVYRANKKLYELDHEHPNVFCINLDYQICKLGLDNIYSQKIYDLSRIFFNFNAVDSIVQYYIKSFLSIFIPSKKVLCVDLDNTLWGGILSDLGPQDICMGQDSQGLPYYRMQLLLKELLNNGVLLAITSKNDIGDVYKVFEHNRDFLLNKEDIAAWGVNWESKSDNILQISENLNLSLDSFAFFDDSEFERAEVKGALPMVGVIEVPKSPYGYASALSNFFGFDRVSITSEDGQKNKQYEILARGKEARARFNSNEEFLISLNLELLYSKSTENNNRVVQLINKTNQFNINRNKLTPAKFDSLMSNSNVQIAHYSLSDIFGSHGTIASVIYETFDTVIYVYYFVLSCRALNRSIEEAIVNQLICIGNTESITQIVFSVDFSSGRNKLAEKFFLQNIFVLKGANYVLFLDKEKTENFESFVNLIEV